MTDDSKGNHKGYFDETIVVYEGQKKIHPYRNKVEVKTSYQKIQYRNNQLF